jgi:uncharacterized membrane protein YbhN (UPF0104 family)
MEDADQIDPADACVTIGFEQILGTQLVRSSCVPVYAFSIGSARVTTFESPSIFPIIAPQHSFGKVASACFTITSHASAQLVSFSVICVICGLFFFVPERLAEYFVAPSHSTVTTTPGALRRETTTHRARALNIRARRHAHQQTFVATQPARHRVGILSFNPQIIIGDAAS